MYRNAVPREITVKHSNSVIKIVFGDLFSFDGFKAIPVSRYFFETQVVSTSLQNKLIQIFVQSKEGTEGFKAYNQAISAALQGENHQAIYRDATIPVRRFELGVSLNHLLYNVLLSRGGIHRFTSTASTIFNHQAIAHPKIHQNNISQQLAA